MIVDEKLTICIPTSVMKTAPSTDLVEYVISKLFDNDLLRNCQIIVSYDYNIMRFGGVAKEYLVNLLNLQDKFDPKYFKFVYSTPLQGWKTGQRQSFLNMADNIRTKYMLHFEHDWVFTETIPFDKILFAMDNHDINYVGFNKRVNTPRSCDYILEPDSTIKECVLTKSSRYSNNPHISKKTFWTKRIRSIIDENPKIMDSHVIEGPVYSVYRTKISKQGFSTAHEDWRVYVYGGINHAPTIKHIDGKKWGPDNA